MGSGSARGWSHIGVINALQRAGIHIDVVAGCSIGSLVGAAFACGKLPELETWVRSFSYWDVLKLMDVSWRRGGLLRGAMEIMTTSIQVLENRLKRNRMAGDPPDILLQPLCPQISTLDFHRAEAAISAGQLAVEKKIDELLPLVRATI